MTKGAFSDLPRHVEPELAELVFQVVFRNLMKPIERKTRICTAQGDAVPLSIENGIVQVFLSWCESARYWPGACDICDIAAVFLYKGKSEREKLTG